MRLSAGRESLAGVVSLLHMAWRAGPAVCAGVVLLEVAQGLFPLGTAWITKGIFDLLSTALEAGAPDALPRELLVLVAAQVLLIVCSQILGPMGTFLQNELGRKLVLDVQARVYRKVNGFAGLAYFEDPCFHDTLRLAVQGAEHRPREALSVVVQVLRSVVTLTAFVAVLCALSLWLTALVFAAVVPQLFLQLRMTRQRFDLATETTGQERRAFTYRLMLSLDRFAKELRLFNLGEYFLTMLLGIESQVHAARRKLEQRHLVWQLGPLVVSSLIAGGAFLVVVTQAFARRLTLGDVSLYATTVVSVQSASMSLVTAFSRLHECVLFHSHFRRLMSLPQPIPVVARPRRVPVLRSGIELRRVSFRYSDRHPWILRDVDVFLPAGASLALVGLNGAGKTTLVKLLCRLYDPTSGEILWDGVDLRELDPQQLRRRIGAIFQDFARYDLTARENVGLGEVAKVTDLAAIRRAARLAGVHDVIERLPLGYDTFLNRGLSQDAVGANLSGGEWQKIAIARMFMREADLLILDEPTAALDAEAELGLYRRFAELTARRTSLVISHRFTTVRMADLIAVLEDGKISEYGSHAQLLASDRSYARLYRMQAERFQEGRRDHEPGPGAGERMATREPMASLSVSEE